MSRLPKSLGGLAFIILVFKNNTFFLMFIMCVLYFMNVSGRLEHMYIYVYEYVSQWFFECVRLAKPEIINFKILDGNV